MDSFLHIEIGIVVNRTKLTIESIPYRLIQVVRQIYGTICHHGPRCASSMKRETDGLAQLKQRTLPITEQTGPPLRVQLLTHVHSWIFNGCLTINPFIKTALNFGPMTSRRKSWRPRSRRSIRTLLKLKR